MKEASRQRAINKKTHRKMGARKRYVKQPFELVMMPCLKCRKNFLSEGTGNRICGPCTLANRNIAVD